MEDRNEIEEVRRSEGNVVKWIDKGTATRPAVAAAAHAISTPLLNLKPGQTSRLPLTQLQPFCSLSIFILRHRRFIYLIRNICYVKKWKFLNIFILRHRR
jgi:hypothetical protein